MSKQNNSYQVLGVMSGTSLDGIDFCLAEFSESENSWKYRIISTKFFNYSSEWYDLLQNAHSLNSDQLMELHFRYGKLIGELAKAFLGRDKLYADLIASHGHTIFHQPDRGFTFQLGCGASIASKTGIKVVSDFRSLDVSLGGQSAPLVPMGDLYLFPDYNCYLNFGGICNITKTEEIIIAYDICPCNMVLNYYTKRHFDRDFDQNGDIASNGKTDQELLDQLNSLPYYHQDSPKSIGREWVHDRVIPIIEQYQISPEDKLNTFCKHIAYQINKSIPNENESILITGGGVKNSFLVSLIQNQYKNITIPNEELISFKEALIFAFLGLRRFLGKPNTLSSVTGSTRDSCGGALFFP